MTELFITPDLKRKTAKFEGAVAAGEAVRVYVVDPDIANIGYRYNYPAMRLRVRVAGRTVAKVDPAADGVAQWQINADVYGDRAYATLNLDTVQMREAFRRVPEMDALFVLDDPDSHVLYFAAPCPVRGWPMEEGEDEPVDLRGYVGFVKDVSARFAEVEANYLRMASPLGEGTGRVGWLNSTVLDVSGEMRSVGFIVNTAENPSAKVENTNGRTVADDIADAAQPLKTAADALKERVDAIMSRTDDPIAYDPEDFSGTAVYSLWYVWNFLKETDRSLSTLQDAHDDLKTAHDKTAASAAQSESDCDELLSAMEDVKAWQSAQTMGLGTDKTSIYKNHVRLNDLETRLDSEMATKDDVDEVAEKVSALSESLKGVEVKTNTMNGIRTAVKVIAQALGAEKVSGIALMFALAAGAVGAATVKTASLGNLDLDTATVVTNVDFTGLATDARLDAKAEKSDVRAVSNDLAAVASSVSTMWWQVYGDTVWMAVTNYMRTTSAKPSMGLWEARDGATNCVWSSAEEIAAATNAVRVELADSVAAARETADAAKSWGRWQSADGSAAVSNYTMVSTPYLMLTGGGKWEQRTVEGGSYWLFCGSGSVGGTDDGGLRLRNSDGDVVFEVTKGTMQEVAAVPESFTVDKTSNAYGDTLWHVEFSVYATSEPTLYVAYELDWNWTSTSPAWTKGDGTYTCTINFPAEYRQVFFRAVYETGSESIVDFKKALKVDKVVVGDTTYTVSVGTMSDGTKFLKLE